MTKNATFFWDTTYLLSQTDSSRLMDRVKQVVLSGLSAKKGMIKHKTFLYVSIVIDKHRITKPLFLIPQPLTEVQISSRRVLLRLVSCFFRNYAFGPQLRIRFVPEVLFP